MRPVVEVQLDAVHLFVGLLGAASSLRCSSAGWRSRIPSRSSCSASRRPSSPLSARDRRQHQHCPGMTRRCCTRRQVRQLRPGGLALNHLVQPGDIRHARIATRVTPPVVPGRLPSVCPPSCSSTRRPGGCPLRPRSTKAVRRGDDRQPAFETNQDAQEPVHVVELEPRRVAGWLGCQRSHR
jgi:hypothetical protein